MKFGVTTVGLDSAETSCCMNPKRGHTVGDVWAYAQAELGDAVDADDVLQSIINFQHQQEQQLGALAIQW